MIHAVVADDEVLARQKLRQLLRDDRDIEIVGESATALETIELVRAANPELLFLDIHMPGMDGFDVLERWPVRRCVTPRVIFTTAYDQYAVRAFEVNAVDYLLKPFTLERLRTAIQRVREQSQARQQETGAGNGTSRAEFLHKPHRLQIARPHPVSSGLRYSLDWRRREIMCGFPPRRRSHLLRETMAHLEERLDPRGFLRVHRSFIVNLKYVKEVRRESRWRLQSSMMDSGHKVALGRSYRASLNQQLHRA